MRGVSGRELPVLPPENGAMERAMPDFIAAHSPQGARRIQARIQAWPCCRTPI
jgi:hypothetical protein